MGRILFLVLLLCGGPGIRAQEPTPSPNPELNFPPVVEQQQIIPTPDWLHPSDMEYQAALDDGYSAKTASEALEGYLPIQISPIQRDPNSGISIESPLHCAVSEGYFAAKALADEPTVAEVKRLCDGLIGVYTVHFSLRLRANWRVMLEHKNAVYHPHSRELVRTPKAERYTDYTGSEVAGYMYDDTFTFKPEEAWEDEVTIIWIDESGEQHSKKINLSPLAREEEELRAEITPKP